MARGSASALTEAGPEASRSTMLRLLLSANARKVRSMSIVWSSIYLSIEPSRFDTQVSPLVSMGAGASPGCPQRHSSPGGVPLCFA